MNPLVRYVVLLVCSVVLFLLVLGTLRRVGLLVLLGFLLPGQKAMSVTAPLFVNTT